MTQIISQFYDAARPLRMQDTITCLPTEGRERLLVSLEGDRRRQANQATWEIFARAMRDYLGDARFEEICQRYDISIQENQEEGLPLKVRHIAMFGVGSADIRTANIKRNDKLSQLTPDEIHNRITEANPIRYLGPHIAPEHLPGHPTEARALFVHSPFLNDMERIMLTEGMESITSPRQFYERFTKAIVGKEIEEKTIIPAPTYDGGVDYYKVYKKISSGGLHAYALKPISAQSSLKPIIIFRGTQIHPSAADAVDTWYDDVSPSIGEQGYRQSQDALRNLMNDPKFCPAGTKVDVAGFSLGGCHAQYFVSDYFDKVKDAYFFAAPGIQPGVAESFAERVNNLPAAPEFKLRIFRTENDLIHYAGNTHLGFGIQNPDLISMSEIIPDPSVALGYRQLHVTRFFDNPGISYTERVIEGEELQRALRNEHRGRFAFWLERLRHAVGAYFLIPIFAAITWVAYRIAALFGYQMRRTNSTNQV